MKITIDIDCTPEEARTFMGLPDVAPLQKEMMQEIGDRLKSTMKSMDPEIFVEDLDAHGRRKFRSNAEGLLGAVRSASGEGT